MSEVHLVIPDQHAHPNYHNHRADWLGNFMAELKPTVVINLGDAADMPSLCSYDKGTKSFEGRRYSEDIEAHLDFQDRLWTPIKKRKKGMPRRIFIEGNHEHRIARAINLQPELTGTLRFEDLRTHEYYHEIVRYSGATPGVIEVDGILYSHYFVSGVKGLPISGEHTGHSLLSKLHESATCGHIHTTDYCVRTTGGGRKISGLVAGVYQDYFADFAGVANGLWWSGVIVKRGVENGQYDPEWVSIERLKREYS